MFNWEFVSDKMPFILDLYEGNLLKLCNLTLVTVWINVQFYENTHCNVWGKLKFYRMKSKEQNNIM